MKLALAAIMLAATALAQDADDGSTILRNGGFVRIKLTAPLPKASVSQGDTETTYTYSLSSWIANHTCDVTIVAPSGEAPVLPASFVDAKVKLAPPIKRGPRVAFWKYSLDFAVGHLRSRLECTFRGEPGRPNETRISDLRSQVGGYFAFSPTATYAPSTKSESGPRDPKVVLRPRGATPPAAAQPAPDEPNAIH